MSDARKELAAIVAKVKGYVDKRRTGEPQLRVLTSQPMKSSASAKEAELKQALSRVPTGSLGQPSPPQVTAKVAFVSPVAVAADSPAGKLLSKIVQAMGLAPQDAASCALSSLPALMTEARPMALVALGEAATRALAPGELPWDRLRGRFASYEGLPLMPTHHPEELLNQEALKRHVWEDMKQVAQKLKA